MRLRWTFYTSQTAKIVNNNNKKLKNCCAYSDRKGHALSKKSFSSSLLEPPSKPKVSQSKSPLTDVAILDTEKRTKKEKKKSSFSNRPVSNHGIILWMPCW